MRMLLRVFGWGFGVLVGIGYLGAMPPGARGFLVAVCVLLLVGILGRRRRGGSTAVAAYGVRRTLRSAVKLDE